MTTTSIDTLGSLVEAIDEHLPADERGQLEILCQRSGAWWRETGTVEAAWMAWLLSRDVIGLPRVPEAARPSVDALAALWGRAGAGEDVYGEWGRARDRYREVFTWRRKPKLYQPQKFVGSRWVLSTYASEAAGEALLHSTDPFATARAMASSLGWLLGSAQPGPATRPPNDDF